MGCSGDPNAGVILIGEAPGKEESEYNAARQKYGEPFVGRSGWALKTRLLAPAGLATVQHREDGWDRVTKINAFIMNTVMCRPPDNKINSVEGKKAVACCSNSAKALLAWLLERNSERTLVPLGGTALHLVTGKASVGPYRGRVLKLDMGMLEPASEKAILKIALRGVKPPEEMLPHLAVLKALVSKCSSTLKAAPKRAAKSRQSEVLALAKPHLLILSAVLVKCRKVLKERQNEDTD